MLLALISAFGYMFALNSQHANLWLTLLDSTVIMMAVSNLVEGVIYRHSLVITARKKNRSFGHGAPMTLTSTILVVLTTIHTVTLLKAAHSETFFIDYVSTFHKNNELFFNSPVPLSFGTDYLALKFSTVTAWIGLAASIYTTFYMKGEPEYLRFLTLLHFFLVSIFLFFKARNVATAIVGWELMGLFSYFLISFWKLKLNATNSGTKAAAYNYLSDAALIIFIVSHYQHFGHTEYTTNALKFFTELNKVNEAEYLFMYSFLILAISCKSVIGMMHFWLPDSMEAPVPASALIHSATLVSAGVYLTLRFKLAFLTHNLLLNYLTLGACVSIVLGALGSITYYDMKKILAYSTISNCGMMILFALYTKEDICFLFFMFHGVYKAYAFFIVGFFFKKNKHKQDYRYFGGLAQYTQGQTFLIAFVILSLGGYPISFMYFIKHKAILSVFGLSGKFIATIVHTSISIATLASLTYSLRIVHCLLYGKPTFKQPDFDKYKIETEYLMVLGLFAIYQVFMYILLKQMVPLAENDTAINLVLKKPQEYNYRALNVIINTVTIVIVGTNAVYGQDTRRSLALYALPGTLMLAWLLALIIINITSWI